jgi:hypothetical protein
MAGASNKLEPFPAQDPNQSQLTYSTSSIGKVFAGPQPKMPGLTGKIGFVVKEGVDPIEGTSMGRVMEGNAGAGGSREGGCACILAAERLC